MWTEFFSLDFVVHLPSCVWLFAILQTATPQPSLSFTISWSLVKLMSVEYDIIHPSHPLSSPSPPAFNLSQYQGLFQWWKSQLFASGGQSIGVSASASVLPMNIQGWFPLGLPGLTLLSKGLSRVSSNPTVRKHQFFGAQPLRSNSHIHTWLLEKPWLWLYRSLSVKWCLCFLKHI